MNYEAIRQANIEEYGKGTRHLAYLSDLYATRTHFIFELLQNTEDAIARVGGQLQNGFAEFRLFADRLELRHNGKPFDENNVKGICGIGEGTKAGDFTQIGKFGVGFKAVYSYTFAPRIHSGPVNFEIRRFVEPHSVEQREDLDPSITLMVLPFDDEETEGAFRKRVSPSTAVNEIGRALKALSPRSLLFLRNIREVRWILPDGEAGKIQKRRELAIDDTTVLVQVAAGLQKETWMLFQQETAVEDFQQRKASVEVGFRIKRHKIVRTNDTELVVFFPTKMQTNLGFLIQGPFKTKVSRESLDEECVANKSLLVACAQLAGERLEFLRDSGRLHARSYLALPIVTDDFPDGSFCRPVFDEIKNALKTRSLLPAHYAGPVAPKFICGNQAVAASDPELRELLTNDELKEALGGDTDWRWLSEDISLDDESELAVYLRDEIEIQEFTASDFVSWLETKDADWWKALDEECLLSAYRYLHSQAAEHKRLRKMPLVRLESGEHVSPDEQALFFPPDNIHEKKELESFMTQLPIILLSLLDDDEDKTVESFLSKIGVARLVASKFIKHYFIPKYEGANDTTEEEDLALGRYLFRAFQRMTEDERDEAAEQLAQIEWLLCRKASQPDTVFLAKPSIAYLGKLYTKDSSLEDYFSASPDTCFVHEAYHEAGEDWLTFLETLGSSSVPRKVQDGHGIEGLEAILAKLSRAEGEECLKLSSTIFDALSASVPNDDYDKQGWGIVTNRVWVTRRGPGGGDFLNKTEPAHFITSLKKTAWLPQISGELCLLGKLFENTDQNRKVLGNRVFYLHGTIKLTTEKHRWLAKELGIQARPTKESILYVLRLLKLAKVNRDEVAPLYAALAQLGANVADEFEKGELIFCPDSDKGWRPQSEVFWNDESPVFGSTRGYLKQIYPELQSFFLNIEVPPNANPADYAEALLEVAKIKAIDKDSRDRIHRIYKRLSPRFDEGGDWQEDETWENYWEELKAGRYWLGRTGEQFGFHLLSELVVVDNEHLEKLFEGTVDFWPYKDLNNFAKQHLELDVCSAAQPDFQVENKSGQQDALSEQLAKAWPCVGDFLQSDKWRNDVVEGRNFTDNPPLVRTAGRIAVIYTLKDVKAEEPDGKDAFFDPTENALWLVPGDTNESEEHFEALSEAIQEYFGPEPLREFVFDLLRKGIEKAEVKWRKRGLMSRQVVPAEPQPTEPEPSNSGENLKAVGGSVASTAERNEGEVGQSENAPESIAEAVAPDTLVNAPSTNTNGVEAAPFSDKFKDALTKPGKAPGSPHAPESSSVSNPERRREQTEKEIAADREKEPRQSERQKLRPRTIWESKNSDVRAKLKEWYAGNCQICNGTFRKRDGDNYFEARYLVPRTVEGARWVDRVGNVLCLCADCSAKFQFGSIESASHIQKKIADLKLVKEGGTQPHTVSIRLCDSDVAINFNERHLIDLQSMLKSDQTGIAPAKSTGPALKNETPTHHLVPCHHCSSQVRADRLEKHIKRHHATRQPDQSRSCHIPPETATRLCRTGCRRTAMQGEEYCDKCM